MTDILAPLSHIHRPRLLMQAAKIAVGGYCRDFTLRRLIRDQPIPGSCQAFLQLLAMEDGCEAQRKGGNAEYDAAYHVEVMTALLGEAMEIGRSRLTQAKASATSDLRLAV